MVANQEDQRVRLFSRTDENLNLLAPILLIFVCLLEVFLQWTFEPKTRIWGRMIGNIILLNTPHTAMTYSMLFSLPEVKHWISGKTGNRPFLFWREILGTLFLLFLFFGVFWKLIPAPDVVYNSTFYLFVFLLDITVLQHHANSQSFGLSMIYNQKIRSSYNFTESELHISRRLEKIERQLFRAMVGITFLTMFCVRMTEFGYLSNENFAPVRNTLFIIGFIVASFLLFIAFRFPRAKQSNKPIFMLRSFVWPFISLSYLADLSQRAIHGIEYTFVYRRMMRNSKLEKEKRRAATAITFALLSMVILIGLFSRQAGMLGLLYTGRAPFVFELLLVLNFSLQFLHCYIDGRLWRMRDPLTRSTIGALLTGPLTSNEKSS